MAGVIARLPFNTLDKVARDRPSCLHTRQPSTPWLQCHRGGRHLGGVRRSRYFYSKPRFAALVAATLVYWFHPAPPFSWRHYFDATTERTRVSSSSPDSHSMIQ